jgi:hypothetical protein
MIMGKLNKLAVVAPGLAKPRASLALVDRFLAGFPDDGVMRGRAAAGVSVFCPGAEPEILARRQRDFGLVVAPSPDAAVAGADGVVVVPAEGHAVAAPEDLTRWLSLMKPGGACWVAGLLGARRADAAAALTLAASLGVRLGAGDLLSVTFRLPEVRRLRNERCREALIVVQGDDFRAKLDGLHGLKPEAEWMPKAGVPSRMYDNDAAWRAAANGEWSWDLLAAALSRSNNPQGDAVTDGRTQDLVGLGIVQRLAQRPRAWVTDHAGGVRTTILALDGVVRDVNLAVRDRSGGIHSAQLYRPPSPNEAGHHRLAGRVIDFLEGGPLPWPDTREVELAAWWEAIA